MPSSIVNNLNTQKVVPGFRDNFFSYTLPIQNFFRAGIPFQFIMKIKPIIVVSALFITMGFTSPFSTGVLIHRLIVQKESKLIINGQTNVNSFQCVIPKYVGHDTLVLQEGGRSKKPLFVKGSVALQASLFDCGMQVMTNDMMNTINANEYPHIIITFISFERLPKYKLGAEKFKGVMTIFLGGTSKQFEVDCTIEAQASGLIKLNGGRKFLFSDFNLVPPQKMMGMIKTQEELNVNFNLVLRLDSDR